MFAHGPVPPIRAAGTDGFARVCCVGGGERVVSCAVSIVGRASAPAAQRSFNPSTTTTTTNNPTTIYAAADATTDDDVNSRALGLVVGFGYGDRNRRVSCVTSALVRSRRWECRVPVEVLVVDVEGRPTRQQTIAARLTAAFAGEKHTSKCVACVFSVR